MNIKSTSVTSILLLSVLLVSCSKGESKISYTPNPTELEYISSDEESKGVVYSDTEKCEVFTGSDWSIYSRYGKQITVHNYTNSGYLKQSEDSIDFVFGDKPSDCEYYLTMTSKSLDKLQEEYELKYKKCKVVEEGSYIILKGADVTEILYDLGDSIYMMIEVYNYYDTFLDDFESMIEISEDRD